MLWLVGHPNVRERASPMVEPNFVTPEERAEHVARHVNDSQMLWWLQAKRDGWAAFLVAHGILPVALAATITVFALGACMNLPGPDVAAGGLAAGVAFGGLVGPAVARWRWRWFSDSYGHALAQPDFLADLDPAELHERRNELASAVSESASADPR